MIVCRLVGGLSRLHFSARSLSALVICAGILGDAATELCADEPTLQSLSVPGDTAEFQAADDVRLDQARQHALESLDRFAGRMRRESQGATWLSYVHYDDLAPLLRTPVRAEQLLLTDVEDEGENEQRQDQVESDNALLQQVVTRLVGLEPGLEMPEVRDLFRSLKAYLVARKLAAKGANLSDEFARRWSIVKSHTSQSDALSPAEYRELFEQVVWMETNLQQSAELARLRSRTQSNARIQIDRNALQLITSKPVQETKPIDKFEDGRHIRGQAVITGNVHLEPVAGSDGVCVALFDGSVATTLRGSQGPVSFGLQGATKLQASQQIFFRQEGFTVGSPVGHASTAVCTECVGTKFGGALGKIVRRVASKKIAEEHPEAAARISRESKDDFLEEFQEQLGAEIVEAWGDYSEDMLTPLTRLDAKPRSVGFRATTDGFGVELHVDGGLGLGAASSPQIALTKHDLAANLHESFANCFLQELLSGRAVNDFQLEAKRMGFNLTEEQLASMPKNIKVTFAADRPAYVEFDGDGIDIWLRGAEYEIEGNVLVGMRVHLRYQVVRRSEGWYLLLQSDPEVLPLDKPSLRFIAQREVLLDRLKRELPTEVPISSFRLSSPMDRLGKLNLVSFQLKDGWLMAQLLGDRTPAPPKKVEGSPEPKVAALPARSTSE